MDRSGGPNARGTRADVGPTANASVSRVFTTRGAFGCRLHPGMAAVVYVQ